MIVLGLILVLLSVGAGVILFLTTDSVTKPVDLEFAGYSWGMTPLALLITGAAVMLLLWLGLGLIRSSVKRRRRPAREAKEAERQAKIEESIRADERARADEAHQSALVERDRVRDEEFETRLADRDRERETEFALRQQEAEERARAYERTRLEQEFAARRATGGETAAAAAVGAAAVGAGAGIAATHADGDHHVPAGDFAARHSADTQVDSGADPAGADDVTGANAMGAGTPVGGTSDDPTHPGYRTVADKIMGRDPGSAEAPAPSDASTQPGESTHSDASTNSDASTHAGESPHPAESVDSTDSAGGTDRAPRE